MADGNGRADRPLVAIVGGDTLLARELRELLGDSKPAPRVQLISSADDGASVIEKDDEEAIVMVPLTPESLAGSAVAFLAGSPASSRRALKLNPPAGPHLIDLSGALEDQHTARLRAPLAETPETRAALNSSGKSSIQVIAHPAAIALATLLAKISGVAPIKRSIVHVFEPASERGQRGLDELQQQTVAVLAFQKLKTDVFDTQLAFNMLARYGEEALEPLDSIEQRFERHLASLLAILPSIPMPSVRMLQSPVFHGHSFSLWIEFEQDPDAESLMSALSNSGIDVRPDEPPSNAGIAGQSGLAVGGVATDRNNPRALWMWMVADNLRLASENAIAVAKELIL